MKPKIPTHVIVVDYKAAILRPEEKFKTEAKREKCRRYIYVYPGETVKEHLRKAWKEDATASVFALSAHVEGALVSGETNGQWSYTV